MARNKVLTIKVSAEEKRRIIEAARHDKRTYSDWSRLVLTAACEESEMRNTSATPASLETVGYEEREEPAEAA